MNKLTTVFLLFLSIQLHAQPIVVKAGIAMAKYDATSRRYNDQYYTEVNNTSFKSGLMLGGYTDFRLGKNLFLRPGLELIMKGSKEDMTYHSPGSAHTFRSSFNFVAFDFPALLIYKSGSGGKHGLVFGGGLTPGVLIEDGLNNYDLGAGLVMGYELPNGLNANLTYNHGLLNVATNSFQYKTLKNSHVGFTVGYPIKKSTPVDNEKREQVTTALEPTTLSDVTVTQPVKAFYAELGGPAGFLSVNMDTRFAKSHKGWGLRAGIGTVMDLDGFGVTLPVALNYLQGKKTHYFEMSAGVSFYSLESNSSDRWFNFESEQFLAPFVWAGYRYQPLNKKFVFRFGFGQFIGLHTPGVFRIPSLSFGYSIK